jgi:DNA polymerase-1
MIVNGVDLSALTPHMPPQNFPAEVPGRVCHIDADFLAYMVSYEKPDQIIELDDMQYNCKVAVEKIRKLAAASTVHLHLTPGTSDKGDRYNIAIQKEYQGNRKDKPKPAKLHIMRDWMGKHFPATLHIKCEADDGMSSAQYASIAKGETQLSVICSKDKDLLMVPGLHVDWDDGTIEQATDEVGQPNDFGYIYMSEQTSSPKIKGYGHKFFWSQMLTGDTADNIQGLPLLCSKNLSKPKKVGPVMADFLLTGVNNNKQAFELVKSLFEETGKAVGFKHWQTGESVAWQKVFISEMQLLWMRREKHDAQCVLKWLKEITA